MRDSGVAVASAAAPNRRSEKYRADRRAGLRPSSSTRPAFRQRCARPPHRLRSTMSGRLGSPAFPRDKDQLLTRFRLTPADASGESNDPDTTPGATATPRAQQSRCARRDGCFSPAMHNSGRLLPAEAPRYCFFSTASTGPSVPRSDRPGPAARVIAMRGMQSPALTRLRRSLRHGFDSQVDGVVVTVGDHRTVCSPQPAALPDPATVEGVVRVGRPGGCRPKLEKLAASLWMLVQEPDVDPARVP
jgi:hypothetical protein